MLPTLERIEPEHDIEQCNLALCVISEEGELRPREAPIVVNHLKGGHTVFVTVVALVEEVVEHVPTPLHTKCLRRLRNSGSSYATMAPLTQARKYHFVADPWGNG